MSRLKREGLEKIKTDIDYCIKSVKEISAHYDSKIHYNELTQSVISSVNSTINSITNSTEYLDGYYLMCDEINPIALTEYLFELKQYNVDKDILSYYIAFYLKRKINSFYKDLKTGSIPIGLAIMHDKKGLKKYYNNCYERATNGLKLLRSKK
jgi:predicted GTPase